VPIHTVGSKGGILIFSISVIAMLFQISSQIFIVLFYYNFTTVCFPPPGEFIRWGRSIQYTRILLLRWNDHCR